MQCPVCNSEVVQSVSAKHPLKSMTLAELWVVAKESAIIVGIFAVFWGVTSVVGWIAEETGLERGAVSWADTPDWAKVAVWGGLGVLLLLSELPTTLGVALVELGQWLDRASTSRRVLFGSVVLVMVAGFVWLPQVTLIVLFFVVGPVGFALDRWRARVRGATR